jgi:DNA-binding response OmpR family regulator
MDQPVIFFIEADNETRPLLRKILKNNGFKVSVAIDEEDALDRAITGCVKADLILMDIPHKPVEEILDIGRKVRRKANLNVPIVVLAASYNEDLEGRDVQVTENEYITYLEDGEQLFNLLPRLIPGLSAGL